MSTFLAPGSTGLFYLSLLALGLLVNLLTLLAFWIDKRRAEAGEWRVPEALLLRLALLGGWPAAKLAQIGLRHKTRKQPFGRKLNRVPLWQALALVLVLGISFGRSDALQLQAQEMLGQASSLWASGGSNSAEPRVKPAAAPAEPGAARWITVGE